jgi:hypothetical protein
MLAAILASVVLLAAPYPKQLDLIVQVASDKSTGFATPVGINTLVTAEHLSGSGLEWYQGLNKGALDLAWQDKKLDLAILRSSPTKMFFPFVEVGPKPEVGDKLFWKIMLYTTKVSWTHGIYLGEDDNGDMIVSGWFHPGSSGSGVLDEQGQIVGVVSAGVNWAYYKPWTKSTSEEKLETLFMRSSFPPALCVSPIGKVKKGLF